MKNIRVLQAHRDSSNRIIKYTIQDNLGFIEDVAPQILKNQIRTGKVQVENYKLTSDNRLIRVNTNKPIKKYDSTIAYVLMNKDKCVAVINKEFKTHINNRAKLPYDYTDAKEWIESRARFSCAKNAKEFFNSIGINNTQDFIDITHCVSLHDTFWIKRQTDKITWSNVSPFRNDYSKVVSTYALEGILIGKDKNYFSPVISTDGTFPHTWRFNNGNIKFIKAGSKYTLGGSNSGREPYSEYYASLIAEYLNFKHIAYNIRYHKRQDKRMDIVTECDCYTSEKIGSVTAHNLGLNSYEDVIEYCKKLGGTALNDILNMLFLDCLLLNTDRHFSNIEFFIDNDALTVLGLVPIFDNNYSLLPRFMEGYDTFERSEFLARDGRTFEDLYGLVKKYKSFNKELISLKKYKFRALNNVQITQSRLDFLNKFLQMQVGYLLKV